jgi:hypothetical protein
MRSRKMTSSRMTVNIWKTTPHHTSRPNTKDLEETAIIGTADTRRRSCSISRVQWQSLDLLDTAESINRYPNYRSVVCACRRVFGMSGSMTFF